MEADDFDDLPPLEDMSEHIEIARKEKEGKKQAVDYTMTRDELDQIKAKEREELDRKMAKALIGERKTEGPIASISNEQSILGSN